MSNIDRTHLYIYSDPCPLTGAANLCRSQQGRIGTSFRTQMSSYSLMLVQPPVFVRSQSPGLGLGWWWLSSLLFFPWQCGTTHRTHFIYFPSHYREFALRAFDRINFDSLYYVGVQATSPLSSRRLVSCISSSECINLLTDYINGCKSRKKKRKPPLTSPAKGSVGAQARGKC
jgi:hypothetical protein